MPHTTPATYIGQTRTTLNRRIQSHSYNGSIKEHFLKEHHQTPTKELILNNTEIIEKEQNYQRLCIKESLLILHHNPSINKQYNNFTHTLKLNPHRNIMNNQINTRAQSLGYNDISIDSTTGPSSTQPPTPTRSSISTSRRQYLTRSSNTCT